MLFFPTQFRCYLFSRHNHHTHLQESLFLATLLLVIYFSQTPRKYYYFFATIVCSRHFQSLPITIVARLATLPYPSILKAFLFISPVPSFHPRSSSFPVFLWPHKSPASVTISLSPSPFFPVGFLLYCDDPSLTTLPSPLCSQFYKPRVKNHFFLAAAVLSRTISFLFHSFPFIPSISILSSIS